MNNLSKQELFKILKYFIAETPFRLVGQVLVKAIHVAATWWRPCAGKPVQGLSVGRGCPLQPR